MLQQLLDDLNSRDIARREDAERRLRGLPPDELMQFAQLEQAQFKRWAQHAWARIAIATFISEIPIVFVLVFIVHRLGLPKGTEGTFVSVPLSLAFCCLFIWFRYKQQPYARHALANVIKTLDDVRFVPVLLTMREGAGCSPSTGTAVQESLIRLLPQLRAEQGCEWTSEQRKVVLGWFVLPTSNYFFELSMAALRALEQVGGEWAIPAVTNCAALDTQILFWNRHPGMNRETQLARTMQIRQAAEACLPFLEQYARQTQQAQTLLRPAASVTPPDTLLRPATSAADNGNGAQLLRPSAAAAPLRTGAMNADAAPSEPLLLHAGVSESER